MLWKQFVPSLFSSSHPNMLLKDVFRVTPAHNLFGANIELSGDWYFLNFNLVVTNQIGFFSPNIRIKY